MSSQSSIILCSGMVRSGSTWSYNVCRSILNAASQPYLCGYFGEEEEVDRAVKKALLNPSKSLILKAHIPGPESRPMIREGSIKNIFTYRDPRDAICSRMKFESKDLESILEVTAQNTNLYNWYRQWSDTLFIRFESMMSDSIAEIQKIAAYLKIPLDDRTVEAIAKENSLEASQKAIDNLKNLSEDRVFLANSRRVDSQTLLQTGHINGARIGRWQDELDPDRQLLVNLAFKSGLLMLEYETEASWRQLVLDLMTRTEWLSHAKSDWEGGDYQSAANLYELAIELEPEVRSHYWHLGLMLLLLGEEEDAQATWLSVMLEAEPEAADDWTAELLRVLQREAERQATLQNEENDRLVWVIRQHIREIAPADLDNTLQLIQQFVRLDILEDFEEIVLEAIALLDNSATPNREVCRQTVQTLLDVAPILPVTAQFTQACVTRLAGDRDLETAIIDRTASLAKDSSFPKPQLIPYFEICHQLQPENVPILVNLINLYQDENQYDRSLELTEKLLSQADTLLDRIAGYYLKIRSLLRSGGDFDKAYTSHETYQSLLLELIDAVENQTIAVDENHLLNLISIVSFFGYLDDRPQQANQFRQKVARVWQSQIQQHFSSTQFDFTTIQPSRLRSDRPLKIGYLSGCLTRHSVGSISRWLFRHHDRDRFQTYGYSLEDTGDFIQQEIASHLSIFHNLSQEATVPEIATQIENDEIDILVDLDSLTSKTGCSVLALKPAPVQVSWLGFDASEIPTIDYFIADSYVLPDAAQTYYSEKIWRLPQTYLAVDGFEVGVPTLRRQQLEIPSDAIVYFSSQTGAKRHPENVRSQMRILHAVPNSYLLIKGLNTDIESVRRFFEKIAAEEGVKCDRLRFLPAAPSEAIHRANLSIADVVLDTYPYNGTTTTLETLWMEIPVVTRVGEQFASRQGYTLLTNAGIEAGIAWTDEEYVEWGIRLGSDSPLRQQIAWKLRQSKKNAPLWNAQGFTRNLEQAYLDIWKTYIRQYR